jgi:hypothetical protein
LHAVDHREPLDFGGFEFGRFEKNEASGKHPCTNAPENEPAMHGAPQCG